MPRFGNCWDEGRWIAAEDSPGRGSYSMLAITHAAATLGRGRHADTMPIFLFCMAPFIGCEILCKYNGLWRARRDSNS